MQLAHKTIVVTGASDGIGREIALALAKRQVKVLLLARDAAKLTAVQNEIIAIGGQAVQFVCDLSDRAQLKQVSSEISSQFSHLDGLINNAGVWQKTGQLDELSDELIDSVLQTNLTGLIMLTKQLLPHLRKAPEAIIINVSSRSGHSAQAGQSVYSASKYGVRGFTEVLRADMDASTIRVAGVYQGGTHTSMFHKAGETWPKEKLETFIPAAELAEVVVFMASRPKQVWLPEVRVESR